jgi:WD repeat-containing protein 26
LGIAFSALCPQVILILSKIQDAEGNFKDSWGETAIRVTDLAITPDLARVIAVGIHYRPPLAGSMSPDNRPADPSASQSGGGNGSVTSASRKSENCMIVYDLATKQTELFVFCFISL